MCEADRRMVGAIGWVDLTVADAGKVRDFYQEVVGWKSTPFDMGGYEDYVMLSPESGEAVSGVCHAQGDNAGLPAQWLMYITVADVEDSAHLVVANGGEILRPVQEAGDTGKFCVIKDPAGAVCALFEWKEQAHHHPHDHEHGHDHHHHHHHDE
jgi:predicted enzyme related to lactoylglutathione lyase